MTPLNPKLDHLTCDLHLTSDQMSDLLICRSSVLEAPSSTSETARAHLLVCAACAAEFASLRETISLFQEANVAHADREFDRLQTLARPAFPVLPTHRAYPQTLFWVAASVVLMAGILPLEMRWQRAVSTTAAASESSAAAAGAIAKVAESDEALLEDVDRELSASVPAPMQALADPAGEDSAQPSIQSDTQTDLQRKD
jgi:hypothetical protein